MPSMKVPVEVYPIFFMIGCALTAGTYVAHKELTSDQDLRLGGGRGYDENHWKTRLENRTMPTQQPTKTRFQNVFYTDVID
ncbi:hypothetical protein HK100_005527 [Physocladia obscura]|uniref:Uncharacterized protein n=1 Tax=Physocladia obscura TaxID=109957 RepID=A0AAD5XD75_9FUNG|nr:hypothetical protein HK100_005527 [Physocladia obscura]